MRVAAGVEQPTSLARSSKGVAHDDHQATRLQCWAERYRPHEETRIAPRAWRICVAVQPSAGRTFTGARTVFHAHQRLP